MMGMRRLIRQESRPPGIASERKRAQAYATERKAGDQHRPHH